MRSTAAQKRRPFIFALCLCEAFVFSLAVLVLPWRVDVLLYGVTFLLVTGYMSCAVLAMVPHPALNRVLRWTAWSSLFAFIALCGQVLWWSLHLHGLYQAFGWALTGGLIVFVLALALFLVPFPLYILFANVHSASELDAPQARNIEAVTASVLPLALLLVSVMVARDAGAATPKDAALLRGQAAAFGAAELLAAEWTAMGPVSGPAKVQGLFMPDAVDCKDDNALENAWIVTFLGEGGAQSHCLKGDTSQKRVAFSELLRSSVKGRIILVDELSVSGQLPAKNSLLRALSLRPGLDGACYDGRCLLPWQLSVQGAFVSYRPLEAVPEARFGVDVESLAQSLSSDVGATLSVIATKSVVLTKERSGAVKAQPLLRMSRGQTDANREMIEQAIKYAENYIMGAQGKDGMYRYTLNPYTGASDQGTVSLPRHAGTTLALCELSSGSKKAKSTVKRALQFIHSHYKAQDDIGFYRRNPGPASLGDTALPLLAQLECAKRGYAPVPEHLASLSRFLMVMQREDGSFSPRYDTKERKPVGEGEALFAAGQAIYALVLAEQVLSAELASSKEKEDEKKLLQDVKRAIDRSMSYYAGPYWEKAPQSFFYLEENWHCLAARAALSSHRNDSYEKFCINYATFKTRFVERSSVLGYRGAYTLSPLFAGHATAASGFGEASAAALKIADARGEALPEMRAALKDTLGYLLQVQLHPDTCFACVSPRAWGGFTESPVSGDVRIDYVQHAMAALGHGGTILGLIERGGSHQTPRKDTSL